MNVQQKTKGFTIIEVVLVLAIAGLIFLMVFIALPALQRSQRDTQRKDDLGRMQTAVENYSSANGGALPSGQTAWNSFVTNYLTTGGSSFIDPSGAPSGSNATTYTIKLSPTEPITTAFSAAQNNVYVTPGAVCATNDGSNVTTSSSRKVALQMVLEGGGVYCVNN